MDYKILDREFRDYSSELKYPFSDKAVLGSASGLVVPSSTFIDILLYVPVSVELPIYLSSVREASGVDTALIEFRDSLDNFVADSVIDLSSDYSIVNRYDIEAGSIVYDTATMRQLVRAAHSGGVTFGNNLPIQTGRCFVYESPHITGIKDSSVDNTQGNTHKDRVFIVAANGVNFEQEGDDVLVHLLGEESPVDTPVRSINGIAREKMWIAAVPDSGVKIETIDNGIKFRSILDE